jgi:D-sedoheptulose 7-phosphate isomerase
MMDRPVAGKVSSRALVRARLEASIEVKRQILASSALVDQIASVADRMAAVLRRGGKIMFFGNGGSAADAQHLAAELVGRLRVNRDGLAALALTTDSSALTAIANDFDFAQVFARQVEALGRPGDVAVGISTSGNSPNVVRAIEAARARALITIGVTGRDGGRLRAVAEECLCVPSTDASRIQESHIVIGHILCELVELELTSGN